MTVKQRLKLYLKYRGITNSKFYSDTKLNRGLIDSDKLTQSLSCEKAAIILEFYDDLSVEWLIMGSGNMIKDTYSHKESINRQEIKGDNNVMSGGTSNILNHDLSTIKKQFFELQNLLKQKDKQIADLINLLTQIKQ